MQRESPKRCEYYGLTLWYHGIYRAGMLYRIRISLRKEHANPDMPGKIILERDYTVDKDTTLTKSTAIPADLLHGMISNALFRRSFFRAICDACPEMYSPDLAWGIAGPYALDAWLRLQSVGRDRQIKFARAMEQMVTLWGEKSVAEITPVNCAKDLMDMAPSRADICLTVLRHLFRSTLAPIVPDPDMWVRYHFSGRKGQYAENHRDREIRDLPILSDKQCADIISTCLIHAKDDHRYLAVLLCLLTPLEPEEIGALKWGDISPLDDYPDVWTIRVRHILIPAEDSRRGAKRQRKVRNVICDISDPHQLRTIPAGRLLSSLLSTLKVDSASTDYLLSDPRNSKRHLSSESLELWINKKFTTIACRGNSHRSVTDYLRRTMQHNLTRYGLREEELRYQCGSPPQHTDARYYVAFSDPAELAGMATVQDVWLNSIGHHMPVLESSTAVMLSAVSGKLTKADLIINIPAECHNVIIDLAAAYGIDDHTRCDSRGSVTKARSQNDAV